MKILAILSTRLIVWYKHATMLHYIQHLGPIVRIDSHWWGDVLIRKCMSCNRQFVDLGSGL